MKKCHWRDSFTKFQERLVGIKNIQAQLDGPSFFFCVKKFQAWKFSLRSPLPLRFQVSVVWSNICIYVTELWWKCLKIINNLWNFPASNVYIRVLVLDGRIKFCFFFKKSVYHCTEICQKGDFVRLCGSTSRWHCTHLGPSFQRRRQLFSAGQLCAEKWLCLWLTYLISDLFNYVYYIMMDENIKCVDVLLNSTIFFYLWMSCKTTKCKSMANMLLMEHSCTQLRFAVCHMKFIGFFLFILSVVIARFLKHEQ